MILLILQTARLLRSIVRIFGSPEGRGIAILIFFQLVIGATFYRSVEGWAWVDAFYFCVASLTTVGYGDVVPATDIGKIFTMIYLITGIGLFVSLGTLIARQFLDERERRQAHRGPAA